MTNFIAQSQSEVAQLVIMPHALQHKSEIVTICRIMSKLLDRVRHAIRLKHFSLRTEAAFITALHNEDYRSSSEKLWQ